MKKISNLHLDYLAEIYHASVIETNSDDRFVSSAELAQRMFTSQSSVNRIIDRLNDLKLIDYERYVGVKLNGTGQQKAVHLLRKQAIIESFLVHMLHMEWHEIYDEALQMRHHVSDAVLQRMWELAGQPQRSPFGEWIDEAHDAPGDIMLTHAEIERDYTVKRILTRQSDRLQYIAALGLMPDVKLKLLHKAPFDGPLQIQLGREYRILGHELSLMMTVI